MDDATVIRFRARVGREQYAQQLLQACKEKGITISDVGNAILPALVIAVTNMHNNIISIQDVINLD